MIDSSQGDVRVDAFAIRPNPIPSGGVQLGGQRIALADFDAGFVPDGPQQVAGVCPKDVSAPTEEEAAGLSELGLQVRLASGEIGGGRALDLTYTIDGGPEQVLKIPFGIWLCASTCPADLGAPTAPPA